MLSHRNIQTKIIKNLLNNLSRSPIIGIDLGTTNSCVAVMEDGKPRVISNFEGSNTTPSVVSIDKHGVELVGISAKRQHLLNPRHTFYATKRLIGRKYDDIETQQQLKLLTYNVDRATNGDAIIKSYNKHFTPTEIASKILNQMKLIAESYVNQKITEAVVTVPAYFDDSQRQATKLAGKLIGLDVRRIINEPTAAALAFGVDRSEGKKIAVFDLGAGTFDISILEILGGVFEVKATNGNTFLGGEDFDQKIVNFLINNFKNLEDVDLSSDISAIQRLKEACENAKIELSQKLDTEIYLPYICEGPKHLQDKLSRQQYQLLCQDLLLKLRDPCLKCLKDSNIPKSEISEVLLVGGMTRSPCVREEVHNLFGFSPNLGVNPDEAVALGAAVQAGILQGEVKDVLLLDVNPLSLGIETLGGIFNKIIHRNSAIPTKKTQIFTTSEDQQTQVNIKIYQGEREIANKNKFLGEFVLTGIPPGRRGEPQIEVSFDIDANGLVKVTAKDKISGKENKIEIVTKCNDDDEIKLMLENAEKNRQLDEIEKKNNEVKREAAEILKSADELQQKIKEKQKKKLNLKIETLKKSILNEESTENIQKNLDDLKNTCNSVLKH